MVSKKHMHPVATIDKMTDNLVDSQVMDVVSKTVIHTNGENNSNVEREKTLM